MAEDIRQYFEAEAEELIARLTHGVAGLSGGELEAEAAQDMLRAAHTLKGASHVMGERKMAGLAHEFEDGVAAYRASPTEGGAEKLLGLVDALSAELKGEAVVIAKVAEAAVEPFSMRRQGTVRVDRADVQRLQDGVVDNDLLVVQMRKLLGRLEGLEGTGTAEMRRVERAAVRAEMRDELDRLARGTREIYRVTSGMQLGSTEGLLLEAGRVVRATAAALGKDVVCVTRGEKERVETPVLDALSDALLHLVRNAVAHGVASAEVRKRRGKPGAATVTVEVKRVGTEVVFKCEDDGEGIALEPIRRAAVARGEMSESAAAGAGEEELLRLLLRPGFSLSGGVDEVSGRGVGLDAVAEAAARVRGRVEIESTVGVGTVFTITVPQAVFATAALDVMAGGRGYAIPVGSVEQTFRMEAHLTEQAGRTSTLLVGREIMSFAWLQDAFSGGGNRDGGTCLVLAAGTRKMALGVERIVGLSEALVRPVGLFAGVSGVVAGTTLGTDGVPRVVVDCGGLMDAMEAGLRQVHVAKAEVTARLPILVVDDSLTTRMLEQSILEAEGYEVELATSAEMGLAMARKKRYGLFLVDVEMPGMDGYGFVATVTAEEGLRETPAILVTSLDSVESRERGRLAGAYSYIVKGEFNQKVYLDRIRSAVGGEA